MVEESWRNAGHCERRGQSPHGILAGEDLEDVLLDAEDRKSLEAALMEAAQVQQVSPHQNMWDAAGLEEGGT